MTSKIKVDNINKVSDDSNIINKCGTTVTVGAASDGVRTGANNLQAADGGNLISQCGTTITLGASGDTINLASGASQSGFGRSGSVNWDTTAKTAGFTGVSGNGYFINTTSGAITVNLPASPSAGDIMSVADYTGTAGTNAITVGRNSSNINGAANDFTIFQNNGSITCVYVDGTEGWRVTSATTLEVVGSDFVVASGGTETTSGDFKIHTFTGPGSFVVSSAGNPTGSNTADYLVIAGGAGGGCGGGGGAGGGGAGGFRTSYCAPATPITMSVTTFPITVGAGGVGAPNYGTPAPRGGDSIFSTITSTGGGGGGGHPHPPEPTNQNGKPGGSGGASSWGGAGSGGGSGNTPPVSPPQGNNGGAGGGNGYYDPTGHQGGGGGGAGGTGGSYSPGSGGATGGAGTANSITGASVTRAGGGGGGTANTGAGSNFPGGSGGSGGGGTGSVRPGGPGNPGGAAGTSGTANTGGGGGGRASGPDDGGTGATTHNGGSGIVIIRYKFQ